MDSMPPLTEAELRGLVRDAIARAAAGRAGTPGAEPSPPSFTSPAPLLHDAPASSSNATISVHVHISQAQFPLGPGGDADGNCIIEPAVRCTHCGYCQTLGH